MAITAKVEGTRVVTGKVRFMYAHLMETYKNKLSGEESYCVTILIPKTDTATVDAINSAVNAAKQEFKARKNVIATRSPLRDGDNDRPEDPLFKDCYFINAKSKFQPDIINRRGETITNPDEVYSGMYGRVSLNFYGYSASGNRGIGAGLGNVQKLEEGDRVGGRMSAKSEFGVDDDNSEESSGLPF